MGSGQQMKCPKCGYTFWSSEGVGFMFPKVYKETVHMAKNGELGAILKTFFEEHPDGVIKVDSVTLCCDDCGYLDSDKDLTMFTPNGKKKKRKDEDRWSVAMPFDNADYVDDVDLKRYYNEYMKYPHKCSKCGGNMHVANKKIKCPDCKIELKVVNRILWD